MAFHWVTYNTTRVYNYHREHSMCFIRLNIRYNRLILIRLYILIILKHSLESRWVCIPRSIQFI